MPKLIKIGILVVLACTCLNIKWLHAQTNRTLHPNNKSILPWNSVQVDSLYKLADHNYSKGWNFQTPQQTPQNVKHNNFTPLKNKGVGKITQSLSMSSNGSQRGSVCYTVSGRNFLRQDSLFLYTGEPSFTSDGYVIVSGEASDYSKRPLRSGGFCMKTDIEGNVIWAKFFDSVDYKETDFMNYFRSVELKNGSILLAGRTTNKTSKNHDFVLTKLDKDGNLIWLKTYESRFWQGYNGSGDYFALKDLEEDTATGEIYFVGDLWGGMSTITKIDSSDGRVLWSKGYDGYDSEHAFGIIINSNDLFLINLGNGYYNDSYINSIVINKTNGNIISSKHIRQTGDKNEARLFNTDHLVKLNNGHYLMSGKTTRYWEYPNYTGTVDLYHGGVIELDENLDFVRAFGFKNRVESNGYNTRISLFPDGSGVFTSLKIFSGYTADVVVSLFNNGQIYHQRKRIHNNEGIPNEPRTLQLAGGGFLNIKMMGDSTKLASDGSRIDYYRMHTSDTASICIGVKDSSTTLWNFNFETYSSRLDKVHIDVFKQSLVKTHNVWDYTAAPGPACQVISHCDTLSLKSTATTVCPGTGITVTINKNKECGSLVPLDYDTTWVSKVLKVNDTTYTFLFDRPGSGYIKGSLMGCILRQDSIYVQVLQAPSTLSLGPDRSLCPGNSITLNARKGYATYLWQDGSADSIYTITQPGLYHVMVTNACGGTFKDSVLVTAAPPVAFNAGVDRTKCNSDTVHLSAPSGFINYSWSNNADNNVITTQNIVVNPAWDIEYYVKGEKTLGCFAYDTMRVIVNTSPPIQLGADKSFCKGDSAVFTAAQGFINYNWSNGSTTGEIVVKNPGSYYVTGITAQGCKSYDTVKVINVYALPVVSLDKKSDLCFGESRTLQAGNFAAYQWSTGATGSSITVNDVGQYKVMVTDINGCKGSDSMNITRIHPLPSGFLFADTAICSYGSLILKPSLVYNNYLWSTGASTPSIEIKTAGTYWLDVTDANTCKGRDSVTVLPKQCMSGFYIPTAFTPNNDGKNDVLKPLIFGVVKQYRFTVYNRWGEVVFQSSDLLKGWDGKLAGMEQRSDVFVWTCTYHLEDEESKFVKGSVMLVK